MFPFVFYVAWVIVFGLSYVVGYSINYRRRLTVAPDEVKEES